MSDDKYMTLHVQYVLYGSETRYNAFAFKTRHCHVSAPQTQCQSWKRCARVMHFQALSIVYTVRIRDKVQGTTAVWSVVAPPSKHVCTSF